MVVLICASVIETCAVGKQVAQGPYGGPLRAWHHKESGNVECVVASDSWPLSASTAHRKGAGCGGCYHADTTAGGRVEPCGSSRRVRVAETGLLNPNTIEMPARLIQTFTAKVISMIIRPRDQVEADVENAIGGAWFGAVTAYAGTRKGAAIDDDAFEISGGDIGVCSKSTTAANPGSAIMCPRSCA